MICKLWAQSPPLTFTALLMSGAFLASLGGIVLDDRLIAGAPAWLKPAKFAISTGIYSLTLAWLFQHITIWPRAMRSVGWITAIVLVVEVAIIDYQAARGRTSHFNLATPLDAALFSIMGMAILMLWIGSIVVAVALFRQKFEDAGWGAALRAGMVITVIGSAAGGLMLRPAPGQTGSPATTRGAHTVGAPDGGPGLPFVNWSTENGDLRVPHFFGLHGIQVIPFLAFLLRRRTQVAPATVRAIALSYITFIGLLTWQALAGQPVIRPGAEILAALAVWAAATICALVLTTGRQKPVARAAQA